ncbi:DUF3800 domain-containing protein [Gulosibacter molinativorax]|nr:DUF3800 domain-containing protein [Gulosibacter molinativorax]QUY62252.1 Hypotetical protein [Gulosibacter molinativorax]
MLLAYLDEVGETGAFVSKDHSRFNTSPAFGYAGFVVPAPEARRFGSWFAEEKRKVYATEIAASDRPAQWEKKGSAIFRRVTLDKYPQQIRVFSALVRRLRSVGGNLFYYIDEKPLGTPNQTHLDTDAREAMAMKETLNRLARHAESRHNHLLVMMDQVNEKQRIERMPTMYAHMFSRSGEFEEMLRIVEPPMHLDSAVSANIQFADWVAACVSRAVEYQLIEHSDFGWITGGAIDAVRGSFTHESKLHLWNKGVPDMHHSTIFSRDRPLYPKLDGQRLVSVTPPEVQRRLRAMAQQKSNNEN